MDSASLSTLIGAEDARLLREDQDRGDPAGALFAEEAPGLPAESERPERKSTGRIKKINI
ncbi:hypothetical protein D0463_03870 [Bacillus sp. V59.32b]|nr:hypothetical protein D0463_03870 [Bacillus sp. V59.32b]